MNQSYRLIFNRARNRWVVASELATSHGKAGTRTVSRVRTSAKLAGVALVSLLLPLDALAECKNPWEWASQAILMPNIVQMKASRPSTPVYRIDRVGPTNTLWLDLYCERNTPETQNLYIYSRTDHGRSGDRGVGNGEPGSRGGNGSDMFVGALSDTGRIDVGGENIFAMKAHSIAGNGGNGGPGTFGSGGGGGEGGNGGSISMLNAGWLRTTGNNAPGMIGISEGGAGGKGGDGTDLPWSSPGVGQSGGSSGTSVRIINVGNIFTLGKGSDAVRGLSVGGNGGNGGVRYGGLGYAVGGDGGGGGRGGEVRIFNTEKTITTQGDHADALSAQSIGGGGGDGGHVVAANIFASFAIGGNAGSGGPGSLAVGSNAGTVMTFGTDSIGLRVQSIGGGGGNGGRSAALSVGLYGSVSTSIGGKGGTGGFGSSVEAFNYGSGVIVTGAGLSDAYLRGRSIDEIDPVVFGANNRGLFNTGSYGIFAQSVGGGGGSGGNALAVALAGGNSAAVSSTVALGGGGGNGGHGGQVTVENRDTASVATYDRISPAILAQSVGGGGGSGGDTLSVAAAASSQFSGTVSVNLGGTGGSGGSGGLVRVNTGTKLTTWGIRSDAVLAQSIGGGGGAGGSVVDVGVGVGSSGVNLGVNLGGSGGQGGSGGYVIVNPTTSAGATTIRTAGHDASGITAQSIGGGGGSGGSVKSYAIAVQKGEGIAGNTTVNVGGTGGSGGTGGQVDVRYNGEISTHGNISEGILAQSLGGGGGAGGSVLALSVAASLNANTPQSNNGKTFAVTVGVGGKGGGGNHSGTVNVHLEHNANVTTAGAVSPAVLAQSIGGGGGVGGNAQSYSVATSLPSMLALEGSTLYSAASLAISSLGANKSSSKGQNSANISVNVGGGGGSGGNGQTVLTALSGRIGTTGPSSHGVIAQSVGGGGGSGGNALTTGLEGIGTYTAGVSVGGSGHSGGNGGLVFVGIQSFPAAISTKGEGSFGVLAQSVGGGGGQVSTNVSNGATQFSDYTLTMSNASASVSVGGSGSAAGNGNSVRVFNAMSVATSGVGANGIVAQSIGGGGGVAGSSGEPGAVLINVNVGGRDGAGGNGADVNVGNFQITTEGNNAIGVLMQSIGGGGGASGIARPKTSSGNTATIVVGGSGGNAGNGAAVNVGCLTEYANGIGCAGTVSTRGNVAHGIVAQSIGGGGGLAQITEYVQVTQPGPGQIGFTDIRTVSTGTWRNGINGDSGKVSVHDHGGSRFNIATSGSGAVGLIAQSLNGGGGGTSVDARYAVQYRDEIVVQGNGTGRNGGVDVKLNGRIVTTGSAAHGIFAQALAGSQTVFGAESTSTLGGKAVANGIITMKTEPTVNISVSGKDAHGIVSMTNLTAASPSQFLQLGGQISATGEGAWAVKASNGFADSQKAGIDAILAVDALGTITAGKNSAGAVSVENYNGGIASLYVYPGGKVTMERSIASDCASASNCVVVSMRSNRRNQIMVSEGTSISGGTVLLNSQGENSVLINGVVRSLGTQNGEVHAYDMPAIHVIDGRTDITIGDTGRLTGGLRAPAASGSLTNHGTVTGQVIAPGMSYTNTGRHLMQISGTGGSVQAINVAALNSAQGSVVVELMSLPASASKPFTPVDLIVAPSWSVGGGIRATGVATTLDLVTTGNKATLRGVRVGFGAAAPNPFFDDAVALADNLANSGDALDASGFDPEGPGEDPSDSLLYDLLLDMANEDDASVVEDLLENFSLGYADAELSLAAAWYAANHLQSCGDNKLATISVIEQGNCSWTKLTYDDMELGGNAQKGHTWGFNAGWQHELREHVYVGLSAGYGRTEFLNRGLSESEGDRFSVGGIVKYVNGNVFGAVSLVGAWSSAAGQRLILIPDFAAVADSDRETWLASARVRGGYNFALNDGISLTPALELNVPLIHDEGYRETGADEFNMEVDSSTNVVPDVYPTIQLSKLSTIGQASVRGWVELGKRVRFNDLDVDVRMPDGFAPEVTTSIGYEPGKTSTVWSTGLQVEWNDRLEARVVYEDEHGSRIHSRTGSIKFAWKM